MSRIESFREAEAALRSNLVVRGFSWWRGEDQTTISRFSVFLANLGKAPTLVEDYSVCLNPRGFGSSEFDAEIFWFPDGIKSLVLRPGESMVMKYAKKNTPEPTVPLDSWSLEEDESQGWPLEVAARRFGAPNLRAGFVTCVFDYVDPFLG